MASRTSIGILVIVCVCALVVIGFIVMNSLRVAALHPDVYIPMGTRHPCTPELVHFIYGFWSSGPMSVSQKNVIRTWKDAGATVRVWGPAECAALWNTRKYAEFNLHGVPISPVQACDFARYMIVHAHGGWYADLDAHYVGPHPLNTSTLSRNNRDKGLSLVETTLSKEEAHAMSLRYPIRKGKPEHQIRIANYAFYAPPDSPWMWDCLQLAKRRVVESYAVGLRSSIDSPETFEQAQYRVLYTTGPDVTTSTVFSKSKPRRDVIVYNRPNELVIHYGHGMWRRESHFATSSVWNTVNPTIPKE